MVDSDGCIAQLIPVWMEAGVHATIPIEVAAGNDIAHREGVPSHKWGEVVILTRAFLGAHVVAPPVVFRLLEEPRGSTGEYHCEEHGSQLLCLMR